MQLRPDLWPALTKLLRDVIVALRIFIYRQPDYEAVCGVARCSLSWVVRAVDQLAISLFSLWSRGLSGGVL